MNLNIFDMDWYDFSNVQTITNIEFIDIVARFEPV